MADGAGQTPPDEPGPAGPASPGSWGAPVPGSWSPPSAGGDGGTPGGWQAPGQPPGGWGSPGGWDPSGGQQPWPGQAPGQPPPGWGPGPWGRPPIAPKPGVIPLRPLSVGEILDGIFSTIRANPGATLGLTLGVSAVVEIVITIIMIAGEDSSTGASIVLETLIFMLTTALGIFLSGVLAVVVSEAALGSRISAGAAIRQAAPRLGGLVVLSIAVMLLSVLGLIALVVGAIVVAVFLSLASPAYVLEGQTVRGALRRSRDLVRGAWWRVFGIGLLAGLVGGILMMIVSVITTVILDSSDSLADSTLTDLTVAGHIVNAIGTLIGTTIATPIFSGTAVLLYIDQRIRKEGLDVTLAEAARQRSTGS
ncbi:hypothetical protein CcI49_33300 [Frankia sp. CcI49]|uniref:hypothetical protein n=1 Tax=unclassified Frankia TaxID=2632575 RepID=UPI0006CA197F|nr:MULTISPECIES: hypothetical protein [unclassified Frankia]KPM51444.1 membrane protein [Frankia sp. R43]ONH52985.1 hypothetical protein CcI49_33300 [Frankia sp. CcI49]